MKNKYKYLKDAVNEDIYNKMIKDFPNYLKNWDRECRQYNYMTDEEVGECGDNLTRFQVAVFGSSETIEEYLNELKEEN